MKRTFDLFVSLIALLALSLPFVIIAIIIKVASPGPVFYRATRVGKHGKLFHLYKFRSMNVGAENKGPKITSQGDSRVTGVGRWLRKLKLDEFPQLVNVIKGEMSLVGPRPEDPYYIAYYSEEQMRVLSVLPGITSAASLNYRNEEQVLSGENWEEKYLNHYLPDKLLIELEYLQKRSLLTDLKIIWKTFLTLFRRDYF